MTRLWPLVVLLALLTPSPAIAVSDYHGLVVSVLDGDTLEVLYTQHPERIRLSAIDCPEKGQPYGNQAKQATVMQPVSKVVRITRPRNTLRVRAIAQPFVVGVVPLVIVSHL
jgi:micrococcal nuclease